MNDQKWLLRTLSRPSVNYIEPVQLVKETPKCFFVRPKDWNQAQPLRVPKDSKFESVHDTLEQARAAGVTWLTKQAEEARRKADETEAALAALQAPAKKGAAMHPGQIDPMAPEARYKPLWAVYGHESSPSLLACMVNDRAGQPTIWGYSVWRGAGGYRTLGISLEHWISREINPRFFAVHGDALACLRRLTAPTEKALKGLQ